MRVVLTGGGTGGHIYPALAIGQAIKRQWPDAELLYIGTTKGLESDIVPASGLDFQAIEVEGWQRHFSFQALRAVWRVLKAFKQSANILRHFSPQLVVATGGYVCLPVAWAAKQQKITTVIHEQNALPGLTNRLLSRRADRVMLTYAASAPFFPLHVQNRLRVTGLPIRSEILKVSREEGLKTFALSPTKLTLLSVGGSRGAQALNKVMLGICRHFAGDPKVQIIHVTGTEGYEAFLDALAASSIGVGNCGNIIIKPYLENISFALACADLCIARAGAAFLAEMTAKGIPGILIPYPYAADNHQEANAQALVDQGVAQMILERDLCVDKLQAHIEVLCQDERLRKDMAAKSLQAGKPEALSQIIELIKGLMKS